MTWKYRATRAADLDALLDQLNKTGADVCARHDGDGNCWGRHYGTTGAAMWVAVLKREEPG